jgi:hypothetical protein
LAGGCFAGRDEFARQPGPVVIIAVSNQTLAAQYTILTASTWLDPELCPLFETKAGLGAQISQPRRQDSPRMRAVSRS